MSIDFSLYHFKPLFLFINLSSQEARINRLRQNINYRPPTHPEKRFKKNPDWPHRSRCPNRDLSNSPKSLYNKQTHTPFNFLYTYHSNIFPNTEKKPLSVITIMAAERDSPEQALHWHYSELDDRNFQIGGKTVFFTVVVLSIIVSVALLLLLATWLGRSRAHQVPVSAKGIPITLYRRVGGSEECAICLGELEDGDKVKVLPACRHCYHSDCVDRWLLARPSCPMCRTSIPLQSILIVTE